VEWAVPAIALAVLGYAAVSRRLDGTPVTAAMVFMGVGLLLGPKVFGVVEPNPGGETVKMLAEATLAVVLFGDAARIDLHALREQVGVPARLLGLGLPLTIVAGFLAALAVFGALEWPEALLLAVILAPTDAALGQAVVTLPSLPLRVRQSLNVESGLNDGLCVPVFVVVLAIAGAEAGLISDAHAARVLVEQIGYGVGAGVGAGALSAAVVVVAGRRGFVEASWLQVVPVAGAGLAYASAAALGGSGFIAAFVGGAMFGAVRRKIGGEVGYFLEEAGALLGAATFVVFGAVLLQPALGRLSWEVVLYAVLSLTVIRMLPVGLAMLGTGARRPTVAFIGWFGPRGLASIVFAVLTIESRGTLPHEDVLLDAVFVTIGLSVLLHGISAAPLARRYARWYAAHPRPEAPEPSPEVPWRFRRA
jgi:NhaP-type Na+/H+ or K+/H+ antiporter